jgi:hypothetical protein
MKIGQHAPDSVPEPARDPMAIDGRSDRLCDNQSHARTRFAIISPAYMND